MWKTAQIITDQFVENYFGKVSNVHVVLTIVEFNEGEKIDRFVDRLKYEVKEEVLTERFESFHEYARIAVKVDGAL